MQPDAIERVIWIGSKHLKLKTISSPPALNAAGNLTRDRDGYEYEYDYENRIVKITKDSSDIAEFAYDALGRRIRKIDSAAGETTLYYYNYNWQVLAEYDNSNNLQRKFIYGNYIDEVLLMKAGENDYYYAHDHLYSPAALIDSSGTVLERYEYDAYGDCSILEPNFAPDPDGKSDYGNPYLFTGRRLDILDNSSLKIQYNRNRYYDYYTGRWLTHDPSGYVDGMNLYAYVASNPAGATDPWGLQAPISIGIGLPPVPLPAPEPLTLDCPDDECPPRWLDPLPSTGRLGDWDATKAFWHFLWGDGANVEFSHESRFAWRCSVPIPWTWGISSSLHNLSRELIREAKTIGMGIQPCKCANFGSSGIAAAGYGYVHGADWLSTLSLGRNDKYSTLYYRAKCCVKKICHDGTYKAKLVCRIRWDIYDLYTYEKVQVVRYLGDDYWQIVHFDKNLDVEIGLEN